MRKKINITIDEELLASLQAEAAKENLSLSRMIENKLKGTKMADLEDRVKKLEEENRGNSIARAMEMKL